MLRCHHFRSQHVLPIEDEPVCICCSGRQVFVATECCQIEQFSVIEDECQFINRFPTVAIVQQMLYCVKGRCICIHSSVPVSYYPSLPNDVSRQGNIVTHVSFLP